MPDEKAVDRRQFLISAATGASVSASLLTSSRCAPPDIKAAASQRVHPVLMRNDHSELIRVTLDVAEGEVRATAFMFSLVYGVFYRGLGIPQEDRVATVWFQDLSLNPLGGQQRSIASQDFLEIRERQRSFGEFSAQYGGTVNVSGVDGPERYQGAFVTANAFDVLQVLNPSRLL